MAKKQQPVDDSKLEVVDTVALQHADKDKDGTVFDPLKDFVPTPIDPDAGFRFDVEDIDDSDRDDPDAQAERAAKNMRSGSPAVDTSETMKAEVGDYVKVMYHEATRRYVQFNQANVGRKEFITRLVLKSNISALNLSA